MTATLANLTQVLNLSPQVGALAGGHLAAVEAARQEAQVEASQRLREVLAQTVLPLSEDGEVQATDPESRRRREAPKAVRCPPLPRQAPRQGRPEAQNRPGAEVARGPYEPVPVVDLRL